MSRIADTFFGRPAMVELDGLSLMLMTGCKDKIGQCNLLIQVINEEGKKIPKNKDPASFDRAAESFEKTAKRAKPSNSNEKYHLPQRVPRRFLIWQKRPEASQSEKEKIVQIKNANSRWSPSKRKAATQATERLLQRQLSRPQGGRRFWPQPSALNSAP